MPLLFLSLKELAMRAVLQEEVSFEDLPPPLRKELDKLSNFHGSYKLIETRSEKFTKTGGGAPTPEEINRMKSHDLYQFNLIYPLPPSPTLFISKAFKTSLGQPWTTNLWSVRNWNGALRLPSRNVTNTLPFGKYCETVTLIGDGDVTYKGIYFKRSTSSSGGDLPSIIYEEEILFEMEDGNKVMKMTRRIILHEVATNIECCQCYVFQRN